MNVRMPGASRALFCLLIAGALGAAGFAEDIGPDTPALPSGGGAGHIDTIGSREARQMPAGAEPEAGSGETALHPARTDANYRIMPSDILSITVFQEEDLKSLVRVSSEGAVVFPLIGSVSVRGLSPSEAAIAIRNRLAGGYLVNPQVNVTVMEYAKHKFTVLGQVQKPGAFDMPDESELTLLQAIGVAGGYTRVANPRKVTLMRRGPDGRKQVFNFDARKMAEGTGEASFTVLPGDVISVAESMF